MGRTTPSAGAPPLSQRKDARAKRAKQTINKDIPALLQAYPRARNGMEASELIVDPPVVPIREKHALKDGKAAIDDDATDKHATHPVDENKNHPPTTSTDISALPEKPLNISLQVADTLEAAADYYHHSKSKNSKSPRIAILNMASPLRPGGGFLNGATSQEESLCMRTTLYPALKEEYYRLPEVGAIYTPDVLVFRSYDADATDMPKQERFFVDVITAAMHRMPEVEEGPDGAKRYANDKDREVTEQKIRGVLRIAKSKGVKRLVLGAWGCGAYGNPVNEIAAAWKKVLLSGEQRNLKGNNKQNPSDVEIWGDIDVVFAIKEMNTAKTFAEAFGDHLEIASEPQEQHGVKESSDEHEPVSEELRTRISELESQIAAARSDMLKDRLRSVLENLKRSS